MKTFAIVVAGVWLCSPLLAVAQPPVLAPATPESRIQNPDWVLKPTGDDMARTYPLEAIKKFQEGQATIRCGITDRGRLVECGILHEQPSGMGFGNAALKLSPLFAMKPTTPDGKPVQGGKVTIPIAWKLSLPVLESPIWVSTPTVEDVMAAYPKDQAEDTYVRLRCDVSSKGVLFSCLASSKAPAFEDAALTLAGKFKTRPVPAASSREPFQVTFGILMASAASPTWKSRELGKIVWIQTADLKMAQAAFPAQATKAGLTSGSAVVDCTVTNNGQLSACAAQSETPADMGFGPAVAEVVEHFVMNPWTEMGTPVGGAHVQFPMKLVHGSGDPAPSAKP